MLAVIPFSIVQISDCHIGAEWTNDPVAGLDGAVSTALSILGGPPDAVLVTGDIAHSGAAAEYEQARELLEGFRAPLFALPGNHDDRARLRDRFELPETGRADLSYAVDLGPVRLLALDTQDPGEEGGRCDPPRERWLAATLEQAPGTPTLLGMHHPPLRTGVPPMDGASIPREECDAFERVVASQPQVQLIAAGHVHRVIAGTVGGVAVLAIPSTADQLALDLNASDFRRVNEPRCFAIHLLVDGRIVSHIVPVH